MDSKARLAENADGGGSNILNINFVDIIHESPLSMLIMLTVIGMPGKNHKVEIDELQMLSQPDIC